FSDIAPTQIYTLSLHDALPIYASNNEPEKHHYMLFLVQFHIHDEGISNPFLHREYQIGLPNIWYSWLYTPNAIPGNHLPKVMSKDRKSTRLNSSHVKISYAVFC